MNLFLDTGVHLKVLQYSRNAHTLTHYINGLEVTRPPHDVDVKDKWRRGTDTEQEHQGQEHAYCLHVLILRTFPSAITTSCWW